MILDEEILSHWFRQQGETNKLYLTSAEKNMLSQVQKKIQYSIVHIALTMMKNYGTTKSYFYIFLLLICEVFLKKHDYIVLKIFHFLKKHFLVFKKLFSIFFFNFGDNQRQNYETRTPFSPFSVGCEFVCSFVVCAVRHSFLSLPQH